MSSLESLFSQLQNQISVLESTLHDTEHLVQGLDKLTIPVEHLSEPNFNDIDHYRLSPFRSIVFRFKKDPIIRHAFLESKKGEQVTYEQLCTFLREYIIHYNLVDDGGLVKCDDFLKQLCGRDKIAFVGLLKEFSKII